MGLPERLSGGVIGKWLRKKNRLRQQGVKK
jgi:hypothetical protein